MEDIIGADSVERIPLGEMQNKTWKVILKLTWKASHISVSTVEKSSGPDIVWIVTNHLNIKLFLRTRHNVADHVSKYHRKM